MSWNDFVGKAYTRQQFAARVNSITWKPEKWDSENPQMPKGIVLHNTAAPSLAQWAEDGPKHDARIKNLFTFYRDTQHWNGGPHLFISRDWINEFDALTEHGTHSPSFNKSHFGIEMVGDYNLEAFDSGDGAKVRDNAVYAMAILCEKFGWDPAKVIVLHKEDPKTDHDCPGKNVKKADVIRRVKAQMKARAKTVADAKPIPGKQPTWQDDGTKLPIKRAPRVVETDTSSREHQVDILCTEFGGTTNPEPSAYTGTLVDPNVPGVALPYKFEGKRRNVRLITNDRDVVCAIVDRGPHNLDDPYWLTGARPAAEVGVLDDQGRPLTNRAGIDATAAAFDLLGIKGKPGTRSVVLDWEFSDDPVGGIAPAHAFFDADNMEPPHNAESVDIESCQVILDDLGYHEVGEIDGKWGGKTAAAIAAFKNDRRLEGPPVLDVVLQDELNLCTKEGWKRPVAPARAQATEEKVAVLAPELRPVRRNRFTALWASISGTVLMVGNAVSTYFQDAMSAVQPVKEMLGRVPGWVWIGLVVVICVYFYYNSRKGANRITEAFRTGERN